MPFRNSASDIADRSQTNGKEAWTNEPIQNGKFTKEQVSEMELEKPAPTASVVVPLDGGWGWVVVAASFCCNTIVDGIVMSAGMFQQPIREEFGVSVSEVIFLIFNTITNKSTKKLNYGIYIIIINNKNIA